MDLDREPPLFAIYIPHQSQSHPRTYISNNLADVLSVFPEYSSCTDCIAILTIIRQNIYGSADPVNRNENCAQELREENSSAANPPSDLITVPLQINYGW